MRRMYLGLTSLVIAAAITLTGCTLSSEVSEMIARNVGLFSAVSWIAIDNPEPEVKQIVGSLVFVIKDSAGKVTEGHTYSEVLYPDLVIVIDGTVDPRFRPLCKAAAATLLGQLDLLFIAHPEWKEDQDLALKIVVAFCEGAKQGLALAETDPLIIQAKKNATRRNLALKGN